jgi:hypothetical protein
MNRESGIAEGIKHRLAFRQILANIYTTRSFFPRRLLRSSRFYCNSFTLKGKCHEIIVEMSHGAVD